MSPFVTGLLIYAIAVLAIGGWAARRQANDGPEEYFLAGRGLGTLVLFMALFGTNATPFVLMGVPGQAYRDGLGIFSLNAPIVALGIPLSFWAIGAPARRVAREVGALTPAELYSKSLGSVWVGRLLVLFFTAYTLPYMVTSIRGAAVALEIGSGGELDPELGALAVLALAVIYTSLGGMRATAWTNVLQGCVFLSFMVVGGWMFAKGIGAEGADGNPGFGGAMQRLASERPDLLTVGEGGLFETKAWASWGLVISLTVVAFPHMFARLLAADSDRSLKRICLLYPGALVLLWVPAVCIGVWGALAFPDLQGRASDGIFPLMVERYLPPGWQALGFIAVLAAVMSTLDAMLLTLGSMVTRDLLPRPSDPAVAGRRDVVLGRWLSVAFAAVVYALWRFAPQSIYGLASVAFSGYVCLTPTLFLGVRWKRFDARAAIGSLLAGNGVYFAALAAGGGLGAAMQPSWGGFLPVVWGLLAGSLVGLLLGLLSKPAPARSAAGA